MKRKLKIGETEKRSMLITRDTFNAESRTVEVAFSSEKGVSRWFGEEVLSHDPDAVNLGRMENGGAVLVGHDHSDQVGVVDSVRIDSDRKGRAVLRFSRSDRGQEIMNDVEDNIRTLVSVGYSIDKYEVEERAGQSDLVTVTRWTPNEISFVPVPADETVGKNRAIDDNVNPTETQVIPMELTPEQKEAKRLKDEADKLAITTKARKDEQARIRSINEINEAFDIESVTTLSRSAISEGMSTEEFNRQALDLVGIHNNAARSESTHDGNVDLTANDQSNFSLMRLMDALSTPTDRAAQERAAFELEVCSAAVQGFGTDFIARGAFIPEVALSRAQNVGTATAGGDLVAQNLLAGEFIELLKNKSATMGAGMKVLSGLVGNYDLPRNTGGINMGWLSGEDADAPEDEATFDQIAMTPKDAAVFTEMTRRSMQQTTPAVEGMVRENFASAFALGIDTAVLYGTGAAGQPTGIANTANINTLTLATAGQATYLELVAMMKLLMEDNAFINAPRWMHEANLWEYFNTASKQAGGTEGNFVMDTAGLIKGLPAVNSQQVQSNDLFLGDFSQVVMGEWGGLEVNVDPFTHSLKGRMRFIAFKTIDLACRHPESFVLGRPA